MARNSFTTGFGAGLGVLLAIFLFPLLLFGGCLVMVGSCGVAAVKSLPPSKSSGQPVPEIVRSPPTHTENSTPAYELTHVVVEQRKSIRGRLGSTCTGQVVLEAPTKSLIASIAYDIQNKHKYNWIFVDFFQKDPPGRVANYIQDDHFDLQSKWDHLTFSRELLYGNVPVSQEAENWIINGGYFVQAMTTVADAEPSFDVYQAFYGAAFRLADIIIDYSGYLANAVAPTTPQTKYMTIYGRKMTANEIWEEDQHKSLQRKKQEQDFAYYIDMLKKSNEQATENAKYRAWTSANGKFTKEAKIISVANGNITLIARDGQKIVVAIDKLCDQDRQFVASWKRKH